MTSDPPSPQKSPLARRMVGLLRRPPYHRAAGLLLSVSGGLDSMVLLDLMRTTAAVHEAPLRVLHVHHGTGRFADASHDLVKRYCDRYKIPFVLRRFSADSGNFEYTAARFRRDALEAARAPDEWIVLAHHLQDQGETCLLTLTRGAGIATPLGMVMQHGRRLRPFLRTDRALLMDYATRFAVPHLLDPGNHDTRNFRNRIRHTVMPELRAVHAGAEARIAGFADDLARLRTGLEADADARMMRALDPVSGLLRRAVFHDSPLYLWDFILRRYWQCIGAPTPRRREQDSLRDHLASGRTGGFDHAGKRLWCDSDGLIWEDAPAAKPRQAGFGTPTAWGPWRLVLHRRDGEAGTYTLHPREGLDKNEKEHLRTHRVPMRLRANLPMVHWDGDSRSLLDMVRHGGHADILVEARHPADLLATLCGEVTHTTPRPVKLEIGNAFGLE